MIQEVKDVLEQDDLFIRRLLDIHRNAICEMGKDLEYLKTQVQSLKKQNTILNERILTLEGSRGQF